MSNEEHVHLTVSLAERQLGIVEIQNLLMSSVLGIFERERELVRCLIAFRGMLGCEENTELEQKLSALGDSCDWPVTVQKLKDTLSRADFHNDQCAAALQSLKASFLPPPPAGQDQ